MDFLGIGLGEILLILVVAFLVWGPARIIEVGRSLGKAIHAFKQAAGELTTQVSKELEEQKKELPQGKQVKD